MKFLQKIDESRTSSNNTQVKLRVNLVFHRAGVPLGKTYEHLWLSVYILNLYHRHGCLHVKLWIYASDMINDMPLLVALYLVPVNSESNV